MKNLLLLFIALAVRYDGYSQSLSPFVISSSGNYSTSPGGSLSSTTGETSMIETFSQSTVILTQGFQQPRDMFVSIQNPSSDEFSLEWYPNPSSGVFNVAVNSPYPGNLLYKIFDNIGKLVWQQEKIHEKGFYKQEISLISFAEGLYRIETLFTDDRGKNQSRYLNTISIIH